MVQNSTKAFRPVRLKTVLIDEADGHTVRLAVIQVPRSAPQKRKSINGFSPDAGHSQEGDALRFGAAKRRRTTIGRPSHTDKPSGANTDVHTISNRNHFEERKKGTQSISAGCKKEIVTVL